jgi:maltose 6'-phosphate phosphatase
MKAVQLLQAINTISRHKYQLQQELVFIMLIENLAPHKVVEVHWAGEDRAWHILRAEYLSSDGANREVWRAQSTFNASDDVSLPGDIEFALRYSVHGKIYWDNNTSSNYFSNADSGVLLEQSLPLLPVDFNPTLQDGQRNYPVLVAARHSLQSKRVFIHWTTDNWRNTQVTPCFFNRMLWDKHRRSSARNPNRYDTSIWRGQIKIDDVFRVQYAIGCETLSRTIWDSNFGHNYVARRRRLKILTLNLHCYQEENQEAKFSNIARAIKDLDIDVVCLQEVGERWRNGEGDWASNAAKIIHDQLRQRCHLYTDWSHIGFERYREGIAVLSRYDFLMKEAGYVSSSHDVHTIDSRKVVMIQVNVPYMGLVNVFCAHLSWPSGGFFHQFERLRTWANQRHDDRVAATFLCGDFNIKAGSEAYQAIVRSGEYEDQYLAATAKGSFEKIFRKKSVNIDRELAQDGRIDFVFMQKHSSLQAVTAGELFTNYDDYGRVSDHTGYYVEFEPNL